MKQREDSIKALRILGLALIWIIALAALTFRFDDTRHSYETYTRDVDPNERSIGTYGHTTMDFGGQWVFGRMIVDGYATELYHRRHQRNVIEKSYPREEERLDAKKHDADQLCFWMMGEDDPAMGPAIARLLLPLQSNHMGTISTIPISFDPEHVSYTTSLVYPHETYGIGGPLYPPIHAFLMAPLALLPPVESYFTLQVILFIALISCGFATSIITNGFIPIPLAILLLALYPGGEASLELAQNSFLTLSFLMWGWAARARGYPTLAGVIWGCLAFKPTWALSFWFALLLLREWRMILAMSATGFAWILFTIPFVGWQSWLDWLSIGKEASRIYTFDANWVPLSRDLLGFPRRFLLDFNESAPARNKPWIDVICWSCWAILMISTAIILILRRKQSFNVVGFKPAFVFLTVWLGTFHFMYYDSLLSYLGMIALFGLMEPWKIIWTNRNWAIVGLIIWMLVQQNCLLQYDIRSTFAIRTMAKVTTELEGVEILKPNLTIGTSFDYGWDTFFILLFWAWSGWRLILSRKASQST
jgi:arabinofuranan 3-O-arabinosyltransferase